MGVSECGSKILTKNRVAPRFGGKKQLYLHKRTRLESFPKKSGPEGLESEVFLGLQSRSTEAEWLVIWGVVLTMYGIVTSQES